MCRPTFVMMNSSFIVFRLQQVAKEPGNVLLCPITVDIALGLLLQGAGEDSVTSAELTTVLGLSGVKSDTKDLVSTTYCSSS